jgi:L-lactate permease
MFSGMVEKTAQNGGLNTVLALSLLLVGGAAGNIISLADILPALTVANLKNKEMEVVKKVFLPCLLYAFLAIILGLSLIFFS